MLNIGQEPSKRSSSPYRTFHVLNDSDYYQPKLLVDSVNTETEPIDQITALYMRGIDFKHTFSHYLYFQLGYLINVLLIY